MVSGFTIDSSRSNRVSRYGWSGFAGMLHVLIICEIDLINDTFEQRTLLRREGIIKKCEFYAIFKRQRSVL
jgi:hypothetical protein